MVIAASRPVIDAAAMTQLERDLPPVLADALQVEQTQVAQKRLEPPLLLAANHNESREKECDQETFNTAAIHFGPEDCAKSGYWCGADVRRCHLMPC
jgi:hypothetical protein